MKSDKSDLRASWRLHQRHHMPLRVTGRTYRKFCRWLDRRLDQLVARWAHTAAPNALRRWRASLKKPKPK